MIHKDSLILTPYGFKPAYRITTNDLIATFDEETNLSWSKPKSVITVNTHSYLSQSMYSSFLLSADSTLLTDEGVIDIKDLGKQKLLRTIKPYTAITTDNDFYTLVGKLLSFYNPLVKENPSFNPNHHALATLLDLLNTLGIRYELKHNSIKILITITKEQLFLNTCNAQAILQGFDFKGAYSSNNANKLHYLASILFLNGYAIRIAKRPDNSNLVLRNVSPQAKVFKVQYTKTDMLYLDTGNKLIANIYQGQLVLTGNKYV